MWHAGRSISGEVGDFFPYELLRAVPRCCPTPSPLSAFGGKGLGAQQERQRWHGEGSQPPVVCKLSRGKPVTFVALILDLVPSSFKSSRTKGWQHLKWSQYNARVRDFYNSVLVWLLFRKMLEIKEVER